MSGTILFIASNPTAIKFDFAGELTAIHEASSKRRPSSLKVVSRWSVSVNGLKSAVKAIRPDIVHLLSPGVDEVTNALILSDAKGRPEYAQPDAVAGAFAQTRFTRRNWSYSIHVTHGSMATRSRSMPDALSQWTASSTTQRRSFSRESSMPH